jgi:hypothetical protein
MEIIKIFFGATFILYAVAVGYLAYGAYWHREKQLTIIFSFACMICFLIGLKLLGWLPK